MAAPLALGAPGVVSASADPNDQAAADAAVTVFNDRLTAAGWTSTGPFTQAEPEGEEETEFGACLNGFERYLDYTDVHFEGETGTGVLAQLRARRAASRHRPTRLATTDTPAPWCSPPTIRPSGCWTRSSHSSETQTRWPA